MERLKRIAAINDISGLGKCSLTIALPVISASGVECSCIPTALLSTHTGEFQNWTKVDLSSQMLKIAEHWREIGAKFDGICSGYLASPAQANLVSEIIDILADENTLIITDPTMADNGEYYTGFDNSMCEAFKTLCKRAMVITPNITEAAFLSGVPYKKPPQDREYVEELFAALATLGPKIIAITGIHTKNEEVGIIVKDLRNGKSCEEMRPQRGGVFYGVGDIFASAFSALLVRGATIPEALSASGLLLEKSIEKSYLGDTPRRFGVEFETVLPEYIRKVEDIFSSKAF
ncbi:MAG: pyridoxamine kinase [Ruminococcaceae bacterium]|nr:pyridoxamine kinase [Oscillospiraceae bacterium]